MPLMLSKKKSDSYMSVYKNKNAVMPTTGDIVISDFTGLVNKQANRPAITFPARICNTMTSSADITIMILYADGTTATHGGLSAFTFANKEVSAIFFADLSASNITITF